MKKVLITGGSGFIGRHCLEPFLRQAEEVHVVARGAVEGRERFAGVHPTDLLDDEQTRRLVASVKPTHLLHLAWFAKAGAFWTSPENVRWVEGSLNLLRAFAENGGRRVVMSGSCAEYDWNHRGDCNEQTTPLLPRTLYGACKHATQLVATSYAREVGLSLAWGRVFFPYGPGEQPQRLVVSVVRSLLQGEPAHCTSGVQERDFIHVQDAANALVGLLASEVEGPVNVASGQAISVGALVLRIATLMGRAELVRLGSLPPREGDPLRLVADVSRLRDEVGVLPRFGLDEGLESTIAWWRDEGQRGVLLGG